jgi:hypothetical protein
MSRAKLPRDNFKLLIAKFSVRRGAVATREALGYTPALHFAKSAPLGCKDWSL